MMAAAAAMVVGGVSLALGWRLVAITIEMAGGLRSRRHAIEPLLGMRSRSCAEGQHKH